MLAAPRPLVARAHSSMMFVGRSKSLLDDVVESNIEIG